MTLEKALVQGIEWLGDITLIEIKEFTGEYEWTFLAGIVAGFLLFQFRKAWKHVGTRASKPGFFGKLRGAPVRMGWLGLTFIPKFIAHQRPFLMLVGIGLGVYTGWKAAMQMEAWLFPVGNETLKDFSLAGLAWWTTFGATILVSYLIVHLANKICARTYGSRAI